VREIFFRRNNGKPLSSIELTRVKTKALESFQELAKHPIVDLAISAKGKAKRDEENMMMQIWLMNYSTDPNWSFLTNDFRRAIISADVTDDQRDEINNALDIILETYKSYNLTSKTEKRLAKKLITRSHLVALTKAINHGLSIEYGKNDIMDWIKKFFDTNAKRGVSISQSYNDNVSGGSLASRGKILARTQAMTDSLDKYIKKNSKPAEVKETQIPQEAEDSMVDIYETNLTDKQIDEWAYSQADMGLGTLSLDSYRYDKDDDYVA
jgi:hypothetical protein